jgi:hypothetical protein
MKNLSGINAGLLCLFMAFMATAQESPSGRTGIMVKYDVISLLGDQVSKSAGLRMGVEFAIGNNQSLETDAMFIFPCASCGKPYTTIYTDKTRGFSISAGYRYYLFPGEPGFKGFHIGPQILYQYTESDMQETYNNGIQNIYFVYRNLLAFHAMAGYQLRIAGPLMFNPVIGIGTRYISSRNANKKQVGTGQHEFPYNKDYENGSQWFPSVTIELKIGLKL